MVIKRDNTFKPEIPSRANSLFFIPYLSERRLAHLFTWQQAGFRFAFTPVASSGLPGNWQGFYGLNLYARNFGFGVISERKIFRIPFQNLQKPLSAAPSALTVRCYSSSIRFHLSVCLDQSPCCVLWSYSSLLSHDTWGQLVFSSFDELCGKRNMPMPGEPLSWSPTTQGNSCELKALRSCTILLAVRLERGELSCQR